MLQLQAACGRGSAQPGTRAQPARGQQAHSEPPQAARAALGAAGNARAGRAGAGGCPRRRWGERDPRDAPERAGPASARALPPPARRTSLARTGAPSARYLINATTLMLLTGAGRVTLTGGA